MKVILSLICLLSVTLGAQYDHQQSYQYLYYSKSAYCKLSEIQNWSGESCQYQPNMTDITVLSNSKFKAQGYVGYNQDRNEIVLAIRGTENLRNWLSNLNTLKTKYSFCKKCKVHKGFYNVFKSLKGQAESAVFQLKQKYPLAQLVVTGHSLGGAAATLAALDLQVTHGITVNHLYTFGAPRVGNKYFAKFLNSIIPQYFRVVHYKDVVPHVPLSVQFFKQGGTEIHYNKNKVQFKNCGQKECSHYLNCQSIDNHVNYLGISTDCNHKLQQEQYQDYEEINTYDQYFEEFIDDSEEEDIEDLFDLNMFGQYMDRKSSFNDTTESEYSFEDFDENDTEVYY